jgi:hypothetical protein
MQSGEIERKTEANFINKKFRVVVTFSGEARKSIFL